MNHISDKIVRIYMSLGRALFPLVRLDDPNPKSAGKRPLHKNWMHQDYSQQQIIGYAKKGHNIGWRLGPLDCIIDIDQRNGGLQSLDKLRRLFPVPYFEDLYPTVQTGGNGFHFYGTLPNPITIRKALKEYPGIDFLSAGKLVVIAGSGHKSGNTYQFDEMSPYTEIGPEIPRALFALLVKDTPNDTTPYSDEASCSLKDLQFVLEQLPVREFNNREDWFQIMCAAHHGTRGAGLKTFLDWSLRDPEYAHDEQIIIDQWEGLQLDKPNPIKIGTIYKAVRDRNGILPVNSASVHHFNLFFEPSSDKQLFKDLLAEVDLFEKETELEKIQDVISRCTKLTHLEAGEILDALHLNTTRKKGDLKTELKELRKRVSPPDNPDATIDVGYVVAQNTIQRIRDDKSDLTYAHDGQFWKYNDTHWAPLFHPLVEKEVEITSRQLKNANPSITIAETVLMGQAETILRARGVDQEDVFRFNEPPPPIINTKSHEIHINAQTGDMTPGPHKKESYLTHCLNTNFDTQAQCTLLDKTLDGIFSRYAKPERKEVIRHLWEVFGYAIQPDKDLAVWVLFYGHGANGKTLMLRLLSAILGNFALNKSLRDLDTSSNAHAFADLPGKLAIIDDDFLSNGILPDAELKKISENKILTANPKYRTPYTFLCTAVPIVASNHWPKTRDLSYGLERRAMVFKFNRRFEDSEMDSQRPQKIIDTELSGVLNRALQGLKRLRQRGNFLVPDVCREAKAEWRHQSNHFLKFLSEEYQITQNGSQEPISSFWDHYNLWLHDQNIKRSYSRASTLETLQSLGCDCEERDDMITGLKRLKGEEG